MSAIISEKAARRRLHWIEKIRKNSGNFAENSEKIEQEIKNEINDLGDGVIVDHLRLCGDIPESYAHDSSEEKLYSKYTDVILCESYKALGLRSLVLKERADVADVEAFAKEFSLVADAKAFRLSRTAKNQKDFKVQAVDGWRGQKSYAMIVCPIYHLPAKTSQIYMQASTRNVCIFTYSHLAMLVAFSITEGKDRAEELLYEVFRSVFILNPAKDAHEYWRVINRTMLSFSSKIEYLWKNEKMAVADSIALAKKHAVNYLAQEREKIMRMGHEEALVELIKMHRVEDKIAIINSVSDNNILGVC